MTPARGTSRLRAWCLFAGLAALVAAADLWSKEAVFRALDVVSAGNPPRVQSQRRLVIIPGCFELEANYNYGAFHGWFSEHTGVLTAISALALAAIAGILAHLLRQPVAPSPLFVAALGLIAGGTAGNLYDRAVLQAVRDWIKWFVVWNGRERVWPNFNIADSGICVGVALIVLLEVRASWSSRAGHRKQVPDPRVTR